MLASEVVFGEGLVCTTGQPWIILSRKLSDPTSPRSRKPWSLNGPTWPHDVLLHSELSSPAFCRSCYVHYYHSHRENARSPQPAHPLQPTTHSQRPPQPSTTSTSGPQHFDRSRRVLAPTSSDTDSAWQNTDGGLNSPEKETDKATAHRDVQKTKCEPTTQQPIDKTRGCIRTASSSPDLAKRVQRPKTTRKFGTWHAPIPERPHPSQEQGRQTKLSGRAFNTHVALIQAGAEPSLGAWRNNPICVHEARDGLDTLTLRCQRWANGIHDHTSAGVWTHFCPSLSKTQHHTEVN